MKQTIPGLLLLLAIMLVPSSAFANNDTNTETDTSAAMPDYTYYTLAPDITTNYVTQGKRLGYLRLQVDLMLLDPSMSKLVEHHAPLIRDAIITVIGQQPEARVQSLAGREEIRQACLAKVNELLIAETNQKLVTELLFTKYLFQ
ncbi:flagellar basal body-associated protein FliL-like protein [Photobacterium aquae]|uniref:Flagellar protein FliL n=1 Tax=Photobacterium aquae TaxID=1195763 RepID=A0A0J1H6Q4_9GAMM|nr:flagellar basal body-associated protein FliL [Photobacterium aquae]KLV07395.1 flagellar basal body-associated protein FliL-like protein [Photobacterium aquae]